MAHAQRIDKEADTVACQPRTARIDVVDGFMVYTLVCGYAGATRVVPPIHGERGGEGWFVPPCVPFSPCDQPPRLSTVRLPASVAPPAPTRTRTRSYPSRPSAHVLSLSLRRSSHHRHRSGFPSQQDSPRKSSQGPAPLAQGVVQIPHPGTPMLNAPRRLRPIQARARWPRRQSRLRRAQPSQQHQHQHQHQQHQHQHYLQLQHRHRQLHLLWLRPRQPARPSQPPQQQ